MKNIDKNTFDNDLNIITDMFEKYSEAELKVSFIDSLIKSLSSDSAKSIE